MSSPNTRQEKEILPKDIIIDLDKPFVDERGKIIPLVDMTMSSCVLIISKKGTIRANHYHKTDWHFCYVLKGIDRKSTRLNSSHSQQSRMPSSA